MQAALSRTQFLDPAHTLYLSIRGQWADGNLDPSRKMSIGGLNTVRAYDVGAVSGDRGYQATIEFHHTFSHSSGQWQGVVFLDSARVTVNNTPWASGFNEATLKDVGAGLNWSDPNKWHARVSIAMPIGSKPEQLGETDSVRTWLEIGRLQRACLGVPVFILSQVPQLTARSRGHAS